MPLGSGELMNVSAFDLLVFPSVSLAFSQPTIVDLSPLVKGAIRPSGNPSVSGGAFGKIVGSIMIPSAAQ